MEEKQLTAVEFLEEMITIALGEHHMSLFINEFNKAKKMEKEHLYNFYIQGGVDAIMEADRNVEQYYNETFKSE